MSSDKGNEKLCAALSYILIGIIWYFADKKMHKSGFVRFHAQQGIVLIIASIAWSVLLNILFMGGIFFFYGLWMLLSWVPLVFVIIGVINAVNHSENELPLIGQFGKKLKI